MKSPDFAATTVGHEENKHKQVQSQETSRSTSSQIIKLSGIPADLDEIVLFAENLPNENT